MIGDIKVKKRKCKWCNQYGEMSSMKCYTVKTGKITKTGKESVRNSFYHEECDVLRKKDEEFKEKEAQGLNILYEHIKSLHNLDVVDGRMFMRIQDLRNGTVTYNGKKLKRYKEGVSYSNIYATYRHLDKSIDYVMRSKNFKNTWNEFAYVFSMVVNNINDVIDMKKKEESIEIPREIISEDFNLNIEKVKGNNRNNTDDMDISKFL